MPSKIRLGLVDDHQIVLDGLMALLKDEQHEIVFSTTNPEEVESLVTQHKIDLLITDIMMPGITGNVLAKAVRKHFPQIKILALSMSGQGALVDEMINDADINGYILKNVNRTQLLTAIDKIFGGEIYFSEEVLDELEQFAKCKKNVADIHLSKREIEIIGLIEKEYNNKQIAEKLFISERTVETHRKNIYRKTGTSSVLGLIKYAYENKVIN